MVVAGAAAGVEAKVIGSDIDRESLNHAKRGIYPEVDMREVPAGIRSRYFRKS
jgi:chemotaxis methyl-accepting protein methylase